MPPMRLPADGASTIGRRRFLQWGAAAGLGVVGSSLTGCSTIRKAASVAAAGSDLGAIEHVVILMMENRSTDHMFGTYRGIRGFDDHPADSLGVFSQAWPDNPSNPPVGRLLPFHFDTEKNLGTCTYDLSHEWRAQHECWNQGRMDAFVRTHTSPEYEGAQGINTMGYYTRADIPYYYALADAFTFCDAYHCSVLAMTDPNRLMWVSGTIDPAGTAGGPVLYTNPSPDAVFSVSWDTMPEVLEDAGISWKYYHPNYSQDSIQAEIVHGNESDAILQYFSQYKSPTSPLYQKAFIPVFPDDFLADVARGTLPQVSWICPPPLRDEHPPAPVFLGESITEQILSALVANPEVWSKTVFFHMYDENDGFFDHVPPPVPPPGTPGEYLTVNPLPAAAGGIAGPVGLGFRVPMTVISPFSRGGYVCSDVFDHTSQLLFLETRFGVRAPNISEWRRKTVGDLTSTLHMHTRQLEVPTLPATYADPTYAPYRGCTAAEAAGIVNPPVYPVPDPQVMARQEPGRARRLSTRG